MRVYKRGMSERRCRARKAWRAAGAWLALGAGMWGCDEGFAGRYESTDGIDQLEFRGGNVYVQALGNETGGKYEVMDERVVLQVNGQEMELRIAGEELKGDGALLGRVYRKCE